MSSPPPFELGTFTLHYKIGEGGMGEVWLGTHKTLGTSVAVKVLREDRIQDPRMRENFLREAESVARLSHPGIIKVFDYGEIPPELASLSENKFAATAPYMTMELANRGSLAQLRGVLSWRQLKWLLTEILSALAHAHARGLIHRDLKPENILLDASSAGQTVIKLTDFGIVHEVSQEQPLSTQDMSSLYAGTPAYMSPEQIRGRWRDFGPWTDLYAVGCIAFELCQGELPFDGNNLFDIAHQQLSQDIPELSPRMPVPDGFIDFVMGLMQKNPADRYQRAIDAVWALHQLPSIDLADISPSPIALLHNATQDTQDKMTSTLITLESDPVSPSRDTLNTSLLDAIPSSLQTLQDGTAGPQPATGYRHDLPPLPVSWRASSLGPVVNQEQLKLTATGLGLHGLREIPLVGRHRERDVIWNRMLQSFHHSIPQHILVEGPPGIGKTRLASWSGARAHELGAAHVLSATHPPQTDPRQGMVRMFSRFLMVSNLNRKKTYKRLIEWLTHHSKLPDRDLEQDAIAITELLCPATEEDNEPLTSLDRSIPEPQLNTPRARFLVISRLLEHLCSTRPLFLIFDDAHRSLESLEIVRLLLSEPLTQSLPIFILITAAHDHTEPIRQASKRVLEELRQHDPFAHIDLPSLNTEEQRELIEATLPLEQHLTEQLVSVSHGNPIFAVQLIGQWIEREVLEATDHGYKLLPEAERFLPETMDQIWSKRISDLLNRVSHASPKFSPEQVRIALQIAATLGKEVSFKEWGLACSIHEHSIPNALVRELTAQGFALVEQNHWIFCHDTLRIQMIEDAKKTGEHEAINMSCARMIDRLYARNHPGAPTRLVDHLLKSHSPTLAIGPLLYLSQRALRQNDYDLCEQHLSSLKAILPDRPSSERNDYVFLKLKWLMSRHGVPRAKVWLDLLKHDRLVQQTPELELIAIALDALQARIPTQHIVACTTLAETCAENGNHHGAIFATLLRAELELARANAKPSRKSARLALELTQLLQDSQEQDHIEAKIFLILGGAYRLEAQHDKATRSLKRAEAFFKQSGDRHGLAMTWLELGHMARTQNNPAAAHKFYSDARKHLQEIYHPHEALAITALAMEALYENQLDESLSLCDKALKSLQNTKLHHPLAQAHLTRAAVYAKRFKFEAWLTEHQQAETLLSSQDVASLEVAQLAEYSALILSQQSPSHAIHAIMLASTHSIRCARSSEVLAQLESSSPLTNN